MTDVRSRDDTAVIDLRTGERPVARGPVTADGKFFRVGATRFDFRGVTYGTFLPRPGDGALFPDTPTLRSDLERMAEAGFTVVRTYTSPTDDLLVAADDFGLRVMAGIFFEDWRYLVGASRRDTRTLLRRARETVRSEVERLRGNDTVLAVCLGNEVPADVLRWVGTDVVARGIADLATTSREVDPDRLVTYANYPTAEYLPLDSLDFLTFNVFLERPEDLRRYLTRLHHLAGDRPLVLGEIGLTVSDDEGGEQRQADLVEWQLETALERGVAGTCIYSWTDEWAVGGTPVEGWHFGITRADRSARPALGVAAKWNDITIRDLHDEWPTMSVVICAYNASETLDECLRHTCALDYPGLDIVVVDDGSTDDTAAIALCYPRARLISIPHAGLSVARNAGMEAATGSIVAYLDSDAYPSPEWPYYLALAFDGRKVGGAGGPNIPPPSDPIGAHRVAQAPGGPVHVLVSDDRAEHVPGCNMAFWRDLLVDVGGFDPIYTSAGDDVDVCWRVLDRGWEIGFHPAALVWHHRRPGLRAYLRQQRGYGRSEALVEARHPDRFTPAGSARWRGRIYNPAVSAVRSRQRIYHGIFGSAPYQSVYQAGGHAKDLAYQLGAPAAVATLPVGALTPLSSWAAVPVIAATALLLALFAVASFEATPPRGMRRGRSAFRLSVGVHHLLQPIVRAWGRLRHRQAARPRGQGQDALPGPVERGPQGTLVVPATRPREEIAAGIVFHLRAAGLRLVGSTGWESYDVRVLGSWLIAGDVVTSAYPEGCVQVAVRRRLRRRPFVALLVAALAAAIVHPAAVAVVATVGVASALRGARRASTSVRHAITGAASA